MTASQHSTVGAEVRASLIAIARPALGLHGNAEGAGDESSLSLADDLLGHLEQLAEVLWDHGCPPLKDGGPVPLRLV